MKIRISNNGPYLVDGPCELVDGQGNVVDTGGKSKLALCRCGQSGNKPFCDGTHAKVGFQSSIQPS